MSCSEDRYVVINAEIMLDQLCRRNNRAKRKGYVSNSLSGRRKNDPTDSRALNHLQHQLLSSDSTIMFGGSGGPWKPRTSDLFIYVNDADEVYKKALNNGATTVLEPENKAYGRSCGVTDPFGNIWWATSIVPAK